MSEIKIHDIKDLSIVNDWSLYIFIILLLCTLLIIAFLIYILFKKIITKEVNKKKLYLNKLNDINVIQSKNAAYEITQYIHLLEKNHIQMQLSKELLMELDKYKYKKEISSFNAHTNALFNEFLESYE